jgi:hypothetical protein
VAFFRPVQRKLLHGMSNGLGTSKHCTWHLNFFPSYCRKLLHTAELTQDFFTHLQSAFFLWCSLCISFANKKYWFAENILNMCWTNVCGWIGTVCVTSYHWSATLNRLALNKAVCTSFCCVKWFWDTHFVKTFRPGRVLVLRGLSCQLSGQSTSTAWFS